MFISETNEIAKKEMEKDSRIIDRAYFRYKSAFNIKSYDNLEEIRLVSEFNLEKLKMQKLIDYEILTGFEYINLQPEQNLGYHHFEDDDKIIVFYCREREPFSSLYSFRKSYKKDKLTTCREMAQLIGVSEATYSNLENGRSLGSFKLWLKIQCLFELSDQEVWTIIKSNFTQDKINLEEKGEKNG